MENKIVGCYRYIVESFDIDVVFLFAIDMRTEGFDITLVDQKGKRFLLESNCNVEKFKQNVKIYSKMADEGNRCSKFRLVTAKAWNEELIW